MIVTTRPVYWRASTHMTGSAICTEGQEPDECDQDQCHQQFHRVLDGETDEFDSENAGRVPGGHDSEDLGRGLLL